MTTQMRCKWVASITHPGYSLGHTFGAINAGTYMPKPLEGLNA